MVKKSKKQRPTVAYISATAKNQALKSGTCRMKTDRRSFRARRSSFAFKILVFRTFGRFMRQDATRR